MRKYILRASKEDNRFKNEKQNIDKFVYIIEGNSCKGVIEKLKELIDIEDCWNIEITYEEKK